MPPEDPIRPDARSEACRELGVHPEAAPDEIRDAFRRQLLRVHPDHNPDPDAAVRTHRLTLAYRLLIGRPASGEPRHEPSEPPGTATPEHTGLSHPDRPRLRTDVRVLDDDSLSVVQPPDETLMLLIEACHELGEITYLDPGAGLIEMIVEFVEAPTSSVVLSTQGRAAGGTTEVFVSVESLGLGPPPPTAAVVRLLAHTLVCHHPETAYGADAQP